MYLCVKTLLLNGNRYQYAVFTKYLEILSGVHSFKEFQNPKNFPDKIRGNDVTKWVKMQYLNKKLLKLLAF